MKVIFLDYNGVIDTYENMNIVNPSNLLRLKRIQLETGAKVVITSSLKNNFFILGYFSQIFISITKDLITNGIEIIDMTTYLGSNYTREQEIKAYLDSHSEINNFCIIDDEYDMKLFEKHMVKLPHQMTIGQKGLEDQHMNLAIQILNNSLIYMKAFKQRTKI